MSSFDGLVERVRGKLVLQGETKASRADACLSFRDPPSDAREDCRPAAPPAEPERRTSFSLPFQETETDWIGLWWALQDWKAMSAEEKKAGTSQPVWRLPVASRQARPWASPNPSLAFTLLPPVPPRRPTLAEKS